jgi:hypothetical protein
MSSTKTYEEIKMGERTNTTLIKMSRDIFAFCPIKKLCLYTRNVANTTSRVENQLKP